MILSYIELFNERMTIVENRMIITHRTRHIRHDILSLSSQSHPSSANIFISIPLLVYTGPGANKSHVLSQAKSLAWELAQMARLGAVLKIQLKSARKGDRYWVQARLPWGSQHPVFFLCFQFTLSIACQRLKPSANSLTAILVAGVISSTWQNHPHTADMALGMKFIHECLKKILAGTNEGFQRQTYFRHRQTNNTLSYRILLLIIFTAYVQLGHPYVHQKV